MGFFGNIVDSVGTALNLPEWGLSETVAGGNKTTNTGRIAYSASPVSPVTAPSYAKAIAQVNGGGGNAGGQTGGAAAPTQSSIASSYTGGNTQSAAVAAKAAQAKRALQLNVQGAEGSSRQSAKDTANKYRTDVQGFLDSTEAKQGQINNDRSANALNRLRSIAAIVNSVRSGLKSGGVTLANMNASDSSAGDALARAYAKEGNAQTADTNNSAQLAESDLLSQQALLDRSKGDTLGNFDRFRDTEIGRIRGDLSNKLQGFDAAAQAEGAGGVDMGIVDRVIQAAISELAGVDQMKNQRLAGINGLSADDVNAKAAQMNTAGVGVAPTFTAGEGGIDLSTENPAEESTVNPIAIKRKDAAATALA